MNLADPELELIDPTPNVHNLFINFDKQFFKATLASRTAVRWSKRMYSAAGVCTYHGRGGFCDIALSEPLLKLRPRKNLVETLLHEMIHAYLFIIRRDDDRASHGPNFQAHMHRINQLAGLNITIYHDFHDEVELYQSHWWRCNGPCQTKRPHFGIVRRTRNSPPNISDYWWLDHQRKCGGTFVKIKEPEKKTKKKTVTVKPNNNADITKYINNNNNSETLNKNLTYIIKLKSPGPINTNKHKIESPTNSPPMKIMKINDYFQNTASTILKSVYGEDYEIAESDNKKIKVVNTKTSVECPVCKVQVDSSEINRHLDECLNNEVIEQLSESNNEQGENLDSSSSPQININKQDDKFEDCIDLTFISIPQEPTEAKPAHIDAVHNVSVTIDLINGTPPNVNKTVKNRKSEGSEALAGSSKDDDTIKIKEEPESGDDLKACPCCGKKFDQPIEEHLEECLGMFDNDATVPKEGASTSQVIDTIVIDDDDENDINDETLTLNATGTKSPCPCCLTMIEMEEMNDHLDYCLIDHA